MNPRSNITRPSFLPEPRRIRFLAGPPAALPKKWRANRATLTDPRIAFRLGRFGAGAAVDDAVPDDVIVSGGIDPGAVVPPPEPGGYALCHGKAGTVVVGTDADGLASGLVTLEQAFLQTPKLPAMAIDDWPAFAFRVHHDDISRKQVSTVEDFRRIIGHLAAFKINGYTPYIEDMLHLASHPDVGEGRGKLMPGEVAAIVEEGRRQGVEVFPTFSLIGHQENLLALPRYRHLGAQVRHQLSSFDPANPALRAFLEQVIGDVCELFPSPWFHMGFDETHGVGKEQFVLHANWCAAQLVKRGKRPMMWVDMIYNHFGVETLRELHPAIVPVVWGYNNAKKQIGYQAAMAKIRPAWGLAGYSNWAAFVPRSRDGFANIDGWARALAKTGCPALMSSMWGDDGYENHRDLCWHLFAALGEAGWRGGVRESSGFLARFQRAFYGAEIPGLTPSVLDLPEQLHFPPREIWQLHRQPHAALVRWTKSNPGCGSRLKRDAAALEKALAEVGRAKRLAKRERGHLDHWDVAFRRTLTVYGRLLAASSGAKLGAAARAQLAARVADDRKRYLAAWLRHNKPENAEVSLAVFDAVGRDYVVGEGEEDGGVYSPLDFGKAWNATERGVAGIPIGRSVIRGIPFAFADAGRTHCELSLTKKPLVLRWKEKPVTDIHLLVTAPVQKDHRSLALLRVELLRGGKTVFADDLSSPQHLCDWWAPMRDHMWGGGGFAFVDPLRVWMAVRLPFYGICCVDRFPFVGAIRADAIRFSVLEKGCPIQIFAATVEHPKLGVES